MAELNVSVDAAQFRALVGKSSTLEPKLKAALRRKIREQAEPAAAAVRAAVMSGPAVKADRGMRAKIAASVKTSIVGTGNSAGVRITVQAPMAGAWESKKGWRHPVFGHDVWAKQSGNPGWFRKSIYSRREQVRQGVEAAMREALDALK